MTKTERESLMRCTEKCLGKTVEFKYKGKSSRYVLGTVEDFVSVVAGEYTHMIQRIKLTPAISKEWGARYAYRTCYYTLSAKRRTPVWGQYHALVPDTHYHALSRKANKKGWLGLSASARTRQ